MLLLPASAKFIFFLSVITFLSSRKFFNYIKDRKEKKFARSEVECLNNALRLRGRLMSCRHNVRFLRECIRIGVAPKAIQNRVKRCKAFHTLAIEKAFLRDELAKAIDATARYRAKYRDSMRQVRTFLGKWDFIRFNKLISDM